MPVEQRTVLAFNVTTEPCGSRHRSGSPYDNAVIESFFNLLKKEELHRRVYRSEQEFLRCVDEYISFYNSSRPHRYNNYKSPDSTEKLFEKSMLSADLP